jgi:hypothetical protein
MPANVSISGDFLIVKGEKKKDKEKKDEHHHYGERYSGSFLQVYQLLMLKATKSRRPLAKVFWK